MGEIDDIVREEQVIHLLEEAEKAMRLVGEMDSGAKKQVQDALDTLWLDIGRTVYNLYWDEALQSGEHGAELAQFTAEVPTEAVPSSAILPPIVRLPSENDLPGFEPETTSDDLGEPDDTGWYTSEVEIPDKPMFGPEDGLEEGLPD